LSQPSKEIQDMLDEENDHRKLQFERFLNYSKND